MQKPNLPQNFKNLLKSQIPNEAEKLFESLEKNPKISIRLNPARTGIVYDSETNAKNKIPWSLNGYYLDEKPKFNQDPLFHAGCYYSQEPASMVVQKILEIIYKNDNKIDQNPLILDSCAAPGGKSTAILDYFQIKNKEEDNAGVFLISNDIDSVRSKILAENMIKWGNLNYLVTSNHTQDFQNFAFKFDFIFTDAPCSSEGMFRKEPESRNHWSLDNVNYCALRQSDILRDLAVSVKPGGYLIYSTCTFNQHENEDVIENFLEENPNFNLIDIETELENFEIKGITSHKLGNYHFYPHKIESEGLFFAILKKSSIRENRENDDENLNQIQTDDEDNDEGEIHKIPHRKLKNSVKSKKTKFQELRGKVYKSKYQFKEIPTLPKIIWDFFDKKDFKNLIVKEYRENLIAFEKKHQEIIENASERLKIISLPFTLGQIKKKGIKDANFIPEKNSYLSNKIDLKLPKIDLNLEEAKEYFKIPEHDFRINLLNSSQKKIKKGWHVLTFQKENIGIIKIKS